MIDDRDVYEQVVSTLPDPDSFDCKGIAEEIVTRYGLCDIGDVPDEEYWGMVARYDISEGPRG